MTKAQRRRGADLENAILKVAWQHLDEVGYENFSMTEVANLAGTSKSAIYKRWPKKVALVMAAMAKYTPDLNLQTSLSGDLRTDLINSLSVLKPIFTATTPKNIQGIIADGLVYSETQTFLNAINGDNLINQQVRHVLTQFGDLQEWTQRQLHLPGLLVINEVLQKGTLESKDIISIVDEELIPVYNDKLVNTQDMHQ
ncbi:hypothetical protein FD29_GL001995 [Companilactobacillus mindensis DSM 14500]|uniref:HTH tetR-type domain-containing protein n=1 Tax=Companilactobacillus mindensis DSM 14500 TaxID=1423770 RepID=A0A0R1QK35_9LACO|nr:TetR/AcrR family transcriptional regulator [Companilactobacillus mindensis]KRL44798.1 hypothetical protein FD29_GL001995 [Companilactobacillus mindensis DSM 14500]GEO78023.1 AcrR family transcriptional regulator [Companilactobacillus mindensis]